MTIPGEACATMMDSEEEHKRRAVEALIGVLKGRAACLSTVEIDDLDPGAMTVKEAEVSLDIIRSW